MNPLIKLLFKIIYQDNVKIIYLKKKRKIKFLIENNSKYISLNIKIKLDVVFKKF